MTRRRTLDIRILECRLANSILSLSRQRPDQTDSRRFVPLLPAPAVLVHPGPPSGLRRTPTFSSTVRGMDVVKLPRGHRPLSPVPSATGHGHCPLVYPRGIRRTTERRWVPRSMGQYARTGCRAYHTYLIARDTRSPVTVQGVHCDGKLTIRIK